MTKIGIVKFVVGGIISVGVGAIVGNTIKTTTPIDTGMIKKACIFVGGFVLVRMIGEKASDYAEGKIDSALDTIKKLSDDGELNEEVVEEN